MPQYGKMPEINERERLMYQRLRELENRIMQLEARVSAVESHVMATIPPDNRRAFYTSQEHEWHK